MKQNAARWSIGTKENLPAYLSRQHIVAVAVAALCTSSAIAQQQGVKEEQLPGVVVTGIKASLIKAQDIKRDAEQIVDSIVADDVGKLPDANVAEALQRIAGVQISRSRGEGDRVQVRGLSQTVSLLNGRSIFTAGKERGLSFQDVPSELLAGVDVYKTPTANQVEGALGGVIDLRMRRPFDFSGSKVAGTLKGTSANLAGKNNAEGSILLSDRWQMGAGEFGALLSIAQQKRNYRMDTQDISPPSALADGSGVFAPTGNWYSYELGERDRTGANLALQYRPNESMDVYLDANHTQLKNKTDIYGHYASPFWANYNPATGVGQLWADNISITTDKVFEKGTFWGSTASTSGSVSDQDTRTRQLALGVNWRGAESRVNAELSQTDGTYWGRYSEIRLGNWDANQYRFDLTTPAPSAFGVFKDGATGAVRDVNLLDPGKYWADKAVYFRQENKGRETVFKVDGARQFDGLISRFRAGLRVTDRLATSAEINTLNNIWTDTPGSRITGARTALDQQIGVIPYNNLLASAAGGQVVKQWLSISNLNWLRDDAVARGAVGLGVPSMDLAQTFEFSEKTSATYGMADFETQLLGKSVTGNFGVRIVNTADTRSFYTANTNAVASVSDNRTDVLPSLNARMEINDKLVARVAASKVVSRPSFDQLTPSLSLNINDKTGFLGNPLLGGLSANQFDTSLEYYITSSDHVYGAAFYKEVNGFIQTSTTPYVYQGDTYTLSTPSNGANGKITGAELGYQVFFTNLPGALRGLGLQANYTFVNSSAPGPLGGQQTQLQNLSRNSYNVVGMYDSNKLALRLAYNYRSASLAGTTNYYPDNKGSIAQTAVYADPFGIWDMYGSYQVSKTTKVALSVNNLLQTKRTTRYAIDNMPKAIYADDRRIGLSLHVEL